jgi:hypothetical protein
VKADARRIPSINRRDTIPQGRVRCPRERWDLSNELRRHSLQSHGRDR